MLVRGAPNTWLHLFLFGWLGFGFFFLFLCVCVISFCCCFCCCFIWGGGGDRGEGVGKVLGFSVFWGFFPLFKEKNKQNNYIHDFPQGYLFHYLQSLRSTYISVYLRESRGCTYGVCAVSFPFRKMLEKQV